MKPVKNLVFAALLVLSLALNTFAGDIQVPGIAAPQPSPTPQCMTIATSEIIMDNTDSKPTTAETADYLFLEVLTALLSVY
jgi:hypothetical protein